MGRTSESLVEFYEAARAARWHAFLATLDEQDFTHDIHDLYARYESLTESVIASNMVTGDLPKTPTEHHPHAKAWTHASYVQDFAHRARKEAAEEGKHLPEQEVQQRAHKKADRSVEKQETAHTRLTGITGRMLPEHGHSGRPQGPNIVAPGSGMGHEQVFKHKDLASKPHTMSGHEFQKDLADLADHRNKGYGIKNASNHEWSAYDVSDKGHEHPEGSKKREKAQIEEIGKLQKMPASKAHPEDYKERMAKGKEGLPHGAHNVGYAKHACGGLTDLSMQKAVEHGYHGFVANTCCSHRLTGVSHEVIAKHHGIPWKHWESLVKASGNLPNRKDPKEDQEHDAKRSRMAQLAIDHYRKKYMEDHGYTVHQGWARDKHGKPEPKGGLLAAAKKGAPLHPRAHDREHVFKGVDLHPHEGELKQALDMHAKGDWGLGQNAAATRKEAEKPKVDPTVAAKKRADQKAAWEARLAAMPPEERAKHEEAAERKRRAKEEKKRKKVQLQTAQTRLRGNSLFERLFESHRR